MALAIIIGMVYYKLTGRDYSRIITASAYVPDIDMIADIALKKIDVTVLIYGDPISPSLLNSINPVLEKVW